LLALRKPIIAIGDTVPTVFPDVAVVRQDDFAAGREMIVRLLERGCVNFHVFKPETLWPSVTQRLEGIRQAVRDCDSSAVVDTISCNESSILKTERLLAGLAPQLGSNSCVIGATDRISTAISRIARSGDNPFRSETLFASFGASETSLDLSVFDVAVQSDPHRIGAEAGRLLLDRIDRNYFDIHESSVRLTLLERKDGR
jgi:DNA-binding LacI/PurR family transcriptional regulator